MTVTEPARPATEVTTDRDGVDNADILQVQFPPTDPRLWVRKLAAPAAFLIVAVLFCFDATTAHAAEVTAKYRQYNSGASASPPRFLGTVHDQPPERKQT
jgi:hypothetical protein